MSRLPSIGIDISHQHISNHL